jgi:hypothetical protein
LSEAANSEYPFAAWQYMSTVWNGFLNGAQPTSSKMPYWMWAVGRAIMPKPANKGRGQIYYKGTASLATPSLAEISLGNFAYSYNGVLYVPGTTDTDMFPNAVAPGSPSANLQQEAFLSLVAFAAKVNQKWRPAEMCDTTVKTVFDKDVSAFCTLLVATGSGYLQGGQAFLATLEIPINTPLISTLLTEVANAETGSPIRFPARACCFGGDELFTSTMLNSFLPISHWGTKLSPKFKCLDFLEIQEVVAMWASKIVTQYFADPALAVVSQSSITQNPTNSICPITLQEMGLLLRNEVMLLYQGTQAGVQSISPIIATGTSDIQFTPYLMGTVGCATQSIGMKLPIPLIENLRGIIVHVLDGRAKGDVEILCPVLGQYYGDVLNPADYTFTTTGADSVQAQTQTFSAEPTVQRRLVSSKGVGKWEGTRVETPIDFVDTSNGTNYVFINSVSRLNVLAALWNGWLETYQAYSSPLGVLSADPGVNVLTSINQTRYWTNVVSENARIRNENVRDARLIKERSLSATPYAPRQVYATSFREQPYAVTAAITTNWLLPISKLQTGNGSANEATFTKIQCLLNEPHSISLSTTGDEGVTLSSIHSNFASSMTHAKGTNSTLDNQLTSLSNAGHAGILSSLVSQFLGNTFGSTVGNVASAVANVLPI